MERNTSSLVKIEDVRMKKKPTPYYRLSEEPLWKRGDSEVGCEREIIVHKCNIFTDSSSCYNIARHNENQSRENMKL